MSEAHVITRMLKNVFKIIALFVIGMVGGIFADQIFWPYFVERPLFYKYNLEQSPVYVTERSEVTIEENTALQEAIKKVERVVVGIESKTESGKVLRGSGLVMTSDGLIVTLAELVPAGSDFTFLVEGKPVSYEVLKRDHENNLALIKVEGSNLATVSFADLKRMDLGQRVFLVGAIPRGEEGEQDLQKIVNEGVIKYFATGSIHTNIFEKYLLAGSPLFDIKGSVMGINNIDAEGKIYAIPISLIREFAQL